MNFVMYAKHIRSAVSRNLNIALSSRCLNRQSIYARELMHSLLDAVHVCMVGVGASSLIDL